MSEVKDLGRGDEITPRIIAHRLSEAARSGNRIIAVTVAEEIPPDAITVAAAVREGNPCVARAIFLMSLGEVTSPTYIGGEGLRECCWGAGIWLGFSDPPERMEEMFSSDSPNPGSMRIKLSSRICMETLRDIGTFKAPGKYLVLRPLDEVDSLHGLLSVVCFGTVSQIRDLGALVHYSEPRAFTPIMAPWGSGCATFIAYPAGLASNGPHGTAFLSPMTPEANAWLPPDQIAMSIPKDIAVRMAEGYETSFAAGDRS